MKRIKPYSIQTKGNTCPYLTRCIMMDLDFEGCASTYQKCITYQRYEKQGNNILKSHLERIIDKFRKIHELNKKKQKCK